MIALWRGLVLVIAALALGGTAMAADAENTLYMDVPFGRVVIAMRPDLAPNTCAQIKALVRRGFYDGVVFHRVIDGFMAQTGDPTGTGMGGSGHKLRAEFSSAKHVRGTVSMARASDPNSADSGALDLVTRRVRARTSHRGGSGRDSSAGSPRPGSA